MILVDGLWFPSCILAAVTNTYLTMAEAAEYLRMPSARALITFRSRYGLPKGIRRGRRILFTKDGLDSEMSQLAERRPGPARIRVK